MSGGQKASLIWGLVFVVVISFIAVLDSAGVIGYSHRLNSWTPYVIGWLTSVAIAAVGFFVSKKKGE